MGTTTALRNWEADVVEAVGAVIEHWGFKFNHGRVWCLLFIRGEAMEASELIEVLGLSKGAVSMITRELEVWAVISRDRDRASGKLVYTANTDFMQMIGRVIENREGPLFESTQDTIARAEEEARTAGTATPDELERLARMRLLAGFARGALDAFTKTAQLDLRALVGAFRTSARQRITGRAQ